MTAWLRVICESSGRLITSYPNSIAPTGHDAGLEDRGDVGSDGEDIKEQELAHLRRLYSVDKFPLTADFEVVVIGFRLCGVMSCAILW